MNKFRQLTLAASLSLLGGCNNVQNCTLTGGENKAYAMAEVNEQCQKNHQLIQKCIVVPNNNDDMYGTEFSCSDPGLEQKLAELVDRTYVECRSSMDPNRTKLTCE